MTTPIPRELLQRSVETLRRGGVVLHPTETVYGFGCDALDAEACGRVRRLKGYTGDRPLIWLVSGLAQAEHHARVEGAARDLALRHWPGPLTLIVPALQGGTVGVRHSPHPVVNRLIEGLGNPMTSTSANRRGAVPPVTADAASWWGDGPDVTLDAGPCPGPGGSTIVDCSGAEPVLVRRGELDPAALAVPIRGGDHDR